jgi:hypothetical protein
MFFVFIDIFIKAQWHKTLFSCAGDDDFDFNKTSRQLKTYMVVNFRARGISTNTK